MSWFKKVPLWSLTCQQIVFKRCHSNKHFWEVLPTTWRRKPTGMYCLCLLVRFSVCWWRTFCSWFSSAFHSTVQRQLPLHRPTTRLLWRRPRDQDSHVSTQLASVGNSVQIISGSLYTMYFARLANTLLKDGESAWDNHALAWTLPNIHQF